MSLNKLAEFWLDLVFPKKCCVCELLGEFLCQNCARLIRFYPGKISLELEENHLDEVVALAEYEGITRQIIAAYKYNGLKGLGLNLAKLVFHQMTLPPTDIIAYVPLHPRKEKIRGFNQAELLAKELGKLLNTPTRPLLIRTQNTSPQAEIKSREERLSRMSQAFNLSPNIKNVPKNVLLIDDVFTTGTTLNECAKILKQNGVIKVYGLAVAHGK